MQLPSLKHITDKTTLTLKRFPLALASAGVGVILLIYLVEFNINESDQINKLILVTALGIPLFTVIQLICEKRMWSTMPSLVAHLIGIGLLLVYYFTLPTGFKGALYLHAYRYGLYILGAHLLVAVGPYWNRGEIGAFWQYNKTLFLRFLTAVLFSAVLFAGLSVALLSIDVLLGVTIGEERYFELFIFIGGIFNTWFFLAGIPASINYFGKVDDYPKGLKIFTQNILIPLVVIYLIILYLYAGKIILQATWPEGWVTILVLSFSVVGILALLLLHPIRDRVENLWIKRFSTGYFWALVPLVVLLMLAIYRRVWEYGITVERYFVIVLGLWLAGMVLYFLISKSKNIKVIPGSLCLLAFLISFGPWGAFSVSERSQINRLKHYLQTNNILRDGSIQKATQPVPAEDEKQIRCILRYLNTMNGLDGLQPWFKQDIANLKRNVPGTDSTAVVSRYSKPGYVMQLMGVEHAYNGSTQPKKIIRHEFYTDQTNRSDVHEVRGANWFIENLRWLAQIKPQEHTLGDSRTVVVETSSESPKIRIYFIEKKQDQVTVNLDDFIQDLSQRFDTNQYQTLIPAKDMTLRLSTDSLTAFIYFKRISWRTVEDSVKLQRVNFDLGLK